MAGLPYRGKESRAEATPAGAIAAGTAMASSRVPTSQGPQLKRCPWIVWAPLPTCGNYPKLARGKLSVNGGLLQIQIQYVWCLTLRANGLKAPRSETQRVEA